MRITAVVAHEWREAVPNRLLVFSVALPPLIFLMPAATVYLAGLEPMGPEELEALHRLEPGFRGLDATTATQLLIINQFMLFFLMIPAIAPLVIASFSIIGENQARSLEPLLATPVEAWELLTGKCLAAMVPGILVTWTGYGLAAIGVLMAGSWLAFLAATSSLWLLSMMTLAPLIGLGAVALAIIISSRVNDTRVAQQFCGFLVIPTVAIFIAQASGQILVSVSTVLLASLGLLAVDVGPMYLAVRLFRQETILVDWR